MPTPNADGPDIARRYQTITGPPDPAWRLFTTKWCEGSQSEHLSGAWRQHWDVMRAWHSEGLVRWIGGYHWLRSDSTPRAQAEFALRLIDGQGGLRPGELWQIDWEPTRGIPLITADQVIEYQTILRQELGERDIVYSSDWIGPEFFRWRKARPNDVYWHANYNTGTSSSGGWAEIERFDADVWQWTSSFRHPSIDNGSDGFDMNHVRKTDGLDRISLLTQPPPPPPPLPTIPDPKNPPMIPKGTSTMPANIVVHTPILAKRQWMVGFRDYK